MSYQFAENETVRFEVDGQTVQGTIIGRGDALEQTYTIDINSGNPTPGSYQNGAILIENGYDAGGVQLDNVAFVSESHVQ